MKESERHTFLQGQRGATMKKLVLKKKSVSYNYYTVNFSEVPTVQYGRTWLFNAVEYPTVRKREYLTVQ